MHTNIMSLGFLPYPKKAKVTSQRNSTAHMQEKILAPHKGFQTLNLSPQK
jgi:hypothetical protein